VSLLLDTNAWLYSVDRPGALPDAIRDLLSGQTTVCLSAISLWEIAKKHRLGKLRLSVPIADWIKHALPDFPNRDPADELIVATARTHGLTLLTCDKLLRDYPHAAITYFRPKDRLA
jgi:PIN domain nuclease of toxin-antitoxin system